MLTDRHQINRHKLLLGERSSLHMVTILFILQRFTALVERVIRTCCRPKDKGIDRVQPC